MYDKTLQNQLFDRSKLFLNLDLSIDNYDDLVESLVFHEWKYYVDNSPLLADVEYDQLFQKLVALEKADPKIIRKDSPSQRVSSDLSQQFETVIFVNYLNFEVAKALIKSEKPDIVIMRVKWNRANSD